MDTLGQIATYELGTWTYLYEKQCPAQHTETPSDDPIITLDDVLLEYLPPTHPHLPLLLGYMTALIKDFTEVIQPLLPSLIFLTRTVSRRATLDLTHCLFEVAEYGWEDFSLCMAISRLIGRDDEYLLWLSRHMNWGFIHGGGIGHLLRLGRDYPSLAALTASIVQICVPRKRTPLDPNLEAVLTELILLVCTHSIQSGSAKQLIPLASALPPQHTPLPSLSLLLHLTIKSYCPHHSNTVLYPLVNRNLTFALLRQVLPSATLKSRLTELFTDPLLAPLAMAISREWKDHIDYDDESDNFESTQEFLERVEREYLTATEGVKWRFEDVLAEWIGEWPDGRQMGSTRVPRTRRITVVEEDDEDEVEEEEEEEFGGSLVKREVPRSGLLMDTPVPRRGVDPRTERRTVLEKLFKLSSIGRTGTRKRVIDRVVDEDAGSSFLDRLGLGQVPLRNDDKPEMMPYGRGTRRNHKRRSILSDLDDEASVYKDSSSETQSTRNVSRKRQRRRRIDDSDDESDENVSEDSNSVQYDDDDDDDNIENQSVPLDSDINPATSDVDELSISIDTNRSALKGITLNKTTRHDSRRSSMRTPNKTLVRESSPVLMDEVSEDELAL